METKTVSIGKENGPILLDHMWHGGEEAPIFFLSRMVVENGYCSNLLNGDGPHHLLIGVGMTPIIKLYIC